MSPQVKRLIVGLAAAAAIVLVATWFDNGVVNDAQRTAGQTFDVRALSTIESLGYIAVAAGVLAIAAVGWWVRSMLFGVIYALVGGFLATLSFTIWQFASTNNGVAPALPSPVADGLTNLYLSLTGPLNAVFIIGGGMFLVGVALIVAGLVHRTGAVATLVPSAAGD